MKKKLIFISGEPVSRIVGEKLNPWYYHSQGLDVVFWNLSEIYYSKESLELYFSGANDYQYKFPREEIFKSKKEVSLALRKEKESLFCMVDFLQSDNNWLLREMKINDINYFVSAKRTPERREGSHQTKKVSSLGVGEFLKRATKFLLYKITELRTHWFLKYGYYKRPSFIAGSGTFGREYWSQRSNCIEFLSVPSEDILWDDEDPAVKDNYGVFVDDAVCFSPDASLVNGKATSTSEDIDQYFERVKLVLNHLENIFGFKFVVAASGKYQYPEENSPFDREVFYGKTNNLIKYSDFVLGHCSSALYQGIVDKKNMALLLDQSLSEKKVEVVKSFGHWLGVETLTFEQILKKTKNDFQETNIKKFESMEKEYFLEKSGLEGSKKMITKKIFEVLDSAYE